VVPGVNTSFANAVSDNGLSVGWSSDNDDTDPLLGIPQMHATLWKNGKIVDLGTLEGGYESVALAANSHGQIVGVSANLVPDSFGPIGTQNRIFLWQKGVMRDLETLSGTDAIAEFINERGEVVGWSYTGAPQASPGCIFVLGTHSFIWDEDHGMRDLGTLTPGGTCTNATAINNKGVVVGDNVNEQQRTFIWKGGAIQDLGGSMGQQAGAAGINDAGQVAGFATLAGEVLFHAVLWQGVAKLPATGPTGPVSPNTSPVIQFVGSDQHGQGGGHAIEDFDQSQV
jgi:probable HAF family extracellular repeat protein